LNNHKLKFNTWGKKQYDVYQHRIQNVRLIWCLQIIKLLKKLKVFKKKISLKDLGSNYFQFYKEIKLEKLNKKIDYFGYESEKKYIDLGLKYYPELKKRYKKVNIENTNFIKTKITLCSATLEHTFNPVKILEKIIQSTEDIVIIRTFVGNKNLRAIYYTKKNNGYLIRQFTKKFFTDLFLKSNFKTKFYLDQATNKKYNLINNDKKFKRKFYIIVAKKINN
jgi:hypothetical protein